MVAAIDTFFERPAENDVGLSERMDRDALVRVVQDGRDTFSLWYDTEEMLLRPEISTGHHTLILNEALTQLEKPGDSPVPVTSLIRNIEVAKETWNHVKRQKSVVLSILPRDELLSRFDRIAVLAEQFLEQAEGLRQEGRVAIFSDLAKWARCEASVLRTDPIYGQRGLEEAELAGVSQNSR